MSSTPTDGGRTSTDASLRAERQRADRELEKNVEKAEKAADEAIGTARERADEVLVESRSHVAPVETLAIAPPQGQIEHERDAEDRDIEEDRLAADTLLDDEREEGRRMLHRFLDGERAMTDRRLYGERSRADAAVASRDTFLAVVCHDLRSMVAAISLGAEAIVRHAPGDESGAAIRKSATRIRRSGGRMSRLLDDLLDVASIEAGHLTVTPACHDAVRLLGEAIDAFRALAADKSVRLGGDVHQAALLGRFDEHRILQVLANLFSNAIKFSPKDSAISASVENHGPDLMFTVRDRGCGIPTEMLEAIFERYRQVAPGRVGLGLGLFISKSIVDAHGGRIWAESTVGEGSTFRFTVPSAAAS